MDMGVALSLHVRAARQRPAPGADQAPAPHSPSSASAFLNDIVRQSGSRLPWMVVMRWQNCLAHLTFYAGQGDAALAHLKEHLSWRLQRGRGTCAGCGQTRGEDTPMLTCSGEVLQRRSPKDGFEKSRIGRESEDGAAQGYLRGAQNDKGDLMGRIPHDTASMALLFKWSK
jgi:hypothetical protein